jgi:hypothetical protein
MQITCAFDAIGNASNASESQITEQSRRMSFSRRSPEPQFQLNAAGLRRIRDFPQPGSFSFGRP